MKKYFLLSLLLLHAIIGFAEPKQPTSISVGTAINIAAKNRMLTQRLGKAYLMKVLEAEVNSAQREIESSTVLFEENLRLLNEFAPTKAIKEEVKRVENQWAIYKSIIQNGVSRDNALQIISGNTEMLNYSHAIVTSLIKYALTLPMANSDPMLSNEIVARNINLSGRCRSLPQRMALYYLAYYAGLTNDLKVFKEAFDEFGQNLTVLLSSTGNTQEIEDALSMILSSWKVLRDDYNAITNKSITPQQIYDLTSQLLNAADRVVILYDAELNIQ